jgi:hypothetical protein
MTALAACAVDNRLDWRKFGLAVMIGGVIPSTLTFLQRSPLPDDVLSITTTTEVVKVTAADTSATVDASITPASLTPKL